MARNYEKTRQKLERTEAQLQKAIETRRRLESQLRELRAQEETERLCSRGAILEKYLREPLLLTNAQIDTLLELMFRSSFTQRQLDELIAAGHKAPDNSPDDPREHAGKDGSTV